MSCDDGVCDDFVVFLMVMVVYTQVSAWRRLNCRMPFFDNFFISTRIQDIRGLVFSPSLLLFSFC